MKIKGTPRGNLGNTEGNLKITKGNPRKTRTKTKRLSPRPRLKPGPRIKAGPHAPEQEQAHDHDYRCTCMPTCAYTSAHIQADMSTYKHRNTHALVVHGHLHLHVLALFIVLLVRRICIWGSKRISRQISAGILQYPQCPKGKCWAPWGRCTSSGGWE